MGRRKLWAATTHSSDTEGSGARRSIVSGGPTEAGVKRVRLAPSRRLVRQSRIPWRSPSGGTFPPTRAPTAMTTGGRRS